MKKIIEHGYHGTTEDKAQKIVSEQELHISTKNTEWLGKGAYLFQYKGHAKRWAIQQVERLAQNTGKQPAIVCAEIEYVESQLLDLDDPDQWADFDEFLGDIFLQAQEYARTPEPSPRYSKPWFQWQNRMRCGALQAYIKIFPEIALAKYTFNFPKASQIPFFTFNQKQICVYKPPIIKHMDYEKIEREVDINV